MRCCCVRFPIRMRTGWRPCGCILPAIGILRDWPSPGQYIDIQNQNHSFDEMALAQSRTFTLTGREQPERVDVLSTQSSLLSMLGAKASAGPHAVAGGGQARQTGGGHSEQRRLGAPVQRRPSHRGQEHHAQWKVHSPSQACCGADLPLNAEVMPSEGPMDKVDIFLPLPLAADAEQRRGDENYNIRGAAEARRFGAAGAGGYRHHRHPHPRKRQARRELWHGCRRPAAAGGRRRTPSLARAAGRCSTGPVDRMRQCGQPSAGARSGSRKRSRRPHRSGSGLETPRAAIIDREHSPGIAGGRGGSAGGARESVGGSRDESRQYSPAR